MSAIFGALIRIIILARAMVFIKPFLDAFTVDGQAVYPKAASSRVKFILVFSLATVVLFLWALWVLRLIWRIFVWIKKLVVK